MARKYSKPVIKDGMPYCQCGEPLKITYDYGKMFKHKTTDKLYTQFIKTCGMPTCKHKCCWYIQSDLNDLTPRFFDNDELIEIKESL